MGSYEYFRKIETNGNLLIFCQLHRILPCSSGKVPVKKNGDIRARWTDSVTNNPNNSYDSWDLV